MTTPVGHPLLRQWPRAAMRVLLLILLTASLTRGQATSPSAPGTSSPTNQTQNGQYPNSMQGFPPNSFNPYTGMPTQSSTNPGYYMNQPNPNAPPSIDQTRWYVENHPDLRNLDPGMKDAIIYGGAGSGLLNGHYLPNGSPNPFYNSATGQSNRNWYLPTTWPATGSNWQGVQPNGFLLNATTRSSGSYTPPYNPTRYQETYNPTNYTTRYQPPQPQISTSNRASTSPTNLSPTRVGMPAQEINSTPVRNTAMIASLVSSREHALAVSETAGDKVGEMVNHIGLAQALVQRGDYAQALAHVIAAEPLVKASPDPRPRVDLLRTKFAAHMQAGDFESALADNREVMPIVRNLNDEAGEAETFLGSAWAFQSIGNIQRAIGCYESAVVMFERAADKDGQVRSRIGLGSLYQSLGQYERAFAQYKVAMPIATQIEQARIFASDAELLQAVGAPDLALAHYQKAKTLLVPGSDPSLDVSILTGMGRSLAAMQAFNDAEKNFVQARTIVEGTQNAAAKAAVIASIGELQYWIAISSPRSDPSPHFKQALKNYDEALPLMRAIGDRAGEIGVLTNEGLVYDAKGKSKDALSYYLQALDKMEELQAQARLEEFRGNIADQSAGLYARAIQLEVETHQTDTAFALSEKARARLFLDKLGNSRIDDIKLASPEFLAREDQLRRENITLERQLGQELSRPAGELNSERVTTVQSRLAAVRASYETLMNELKLSNPSYAAFLSVSPITVAEAQRRIDFGTTIVSFYTEPGEAFAFILTSNSFKVKKLEIGQAELVHEISTFRDFAGVNEISPSLRILYKALVAPIRSELKTAKVVFVPHGVLHELPFGALTPDGYRFLSDDFSISYLPSVSALSYLHAKRGSPAPRALVLVSDQAQGFAQLSAANDEGRSIANFFETKPLLGKDATAGILRKDAANYDIVHLVAHFEINQINPMASQILLSRGEKDDDTPLDLMGVYGLHLARTDLVVLSGCQSQSGKRTRGDDIVGLSQAFLYAGSPSVIASLWNVDDEATKLLMVAFYTHLRQGLPKSESLRAAQLEVRHKYPSPFYWAGFVLTGDPGSRELSTSVAAN